MIKVQCDRCPAMTLNTVANMATLALVNHTAERSAYQESLHLCQECLSDFRRWLRSGPIAGDGASLTPVGSDPAAALSSLGGLS